MGKNVVICCDGTANQFTKDNTNVIKLYSALIDDPGRQTIFYHPGVGTWEAPGALTTWGREVTIALGKAFGYGLESDIAAVYAFVMNNYRAADNDKLFFFGFSRGAYTVRAVASLLHAFGVLRPAHETSIPYAIRLMNSIGQGTKGSLDAFCVIDRFRATFSVDAAKTYFIGAWDTVSSVGWISNPLHIPYSASNPDIAIARHAVSIDERRSFFRQNLWWPSGGPGKAGPQDLKQVWFAGAHCDIGGGYAEEESGLSKIALRWMFKEAEAKGLLVDAGRRDAVIAAGQGPDANGPMHDELIGQLGWHIVEYVPKRHYDRETGKTEFRANRGQPRHLPRGALIHESAFKRANYTVPKPEDYKVETD
jgi:uncharacterized protein (DUF2235 family)